MADIKWKSDISWIMEEFDDSWRLTDKEGFTGIDVNANNKLDPSERVDRNRDNFVSEDEWALFLKENKDLLSRFKAFGAYFRNGQAFSLDNPIHDLLRIEGEVVDEPDIDNAYKQTAEILEKVKAGLDKGFARSAREKLRMVYNEIQNSGISYGATMLFSPALAKGHLDCDTMSFMVISIAHEMGWPVKLMLAPRHAFVKWNDGEGIDFNMDFGMSAADEIYKERLFTSNQILKVESVGDGYLKGLDAKQLLAQFYTNVGAYLFEQHNLYLAEEKLNKALELDPKNIFAYYSLTYVYAHQDEAEKAIQALDKALSLCPYTASAYVMMAKLQFFGSHYKKAIGAINRAMVMEPERRPAYLLFRAQCLREMKQVQRAIGDLNEAIDLKPSWSDLYALRGELKMEQGYFDGSVRDFDTAMKLEPNSASWLNAKREEAAREATKKIASPINTNRRPDEPQVKKIELKNFTLFSW